MQDDTQQTVRNEPRKRALSIIKDHNAIYFFPLISTIIICFFLLNYIVIIFSFDMVQQIIQSKTRNIGLLIGVYFFFGPLVCIPIISILKNAALTFYIHAIDSKQKKSLVLCCYLALKKLPTLITLKLYSSVVYIFLKAMRVFPSVRSKKIASFLLLDVSWDAISGPLMPMVLLKNVSPSAASIYLMKNLSVNRLQYYLKSDYKLFSLRSFLVMSFGLGLIWFAQKLPVYAEIMILTTGMIVLIANNSYEDMIKVISKYQVYSDLFSDVRAKDISSVKTGSVF